MVILVLNCGSSSLKFSVYDIEPNANRLLAHGGIDRIGQEESAILLESEGKPALGRSAAISNHQEAIATILKDLLTDPEHGCIGSLDEVQAIGHRVVHGGEHFSSATIVTPDVKSAIDDCCRFAPLHNPANLNGIWACDRLVEKVPQVAVFDTAFHSTMPPEAYFYALPRKLYEERGIRRYGFHGTSHYYVAGEATKLLDAAGVAAPHHIVTCHLGNGASVAAVRDGRCIDTSMGFTPLEGLAMGTRCGDIDPAIVLHLLHEYGLSQLDRLLNKESGLKGLTGYSDMRDVIAVADGRGLHGESDSPSASDTEMAQIALKLYAYRVRKYVGAYAAALGKLDAVVFTAGIGERSSRVRSLVLDNLSVLGITVDSSKNEANETLITTPDSAIKVFVIPTNEELVIAQQTYALVC